jgi:lipoprotein-releasing system permease protein
MSTAPVELVWWQVMLVALGTFVVCFTVLMVPSLISRRISPATAVQFR